MLQEKLHTCDEAAALLNVKPSTIRAWTSRRRITCVKLNGGRAVRYRQSDLEKLIKAGLRPALRPLCAPEGSGENGGER
jgi:excisionase family DNA binding protein